MSEYEEMQQLAEMTTASWIIWGVILAAVLAVAIILTIRDKREE